MAFGGASYTDFVTNGGLNPTYGTPCVAGADTLVTGLAPTAKTSSCFDEITWQDLGPKYNRSSDWGDNLQAGAEQLSIAQAHRSGGHKKTKCSKVHERGRLLVFGEGIKMAQVALIESTMLVGRVRG